MTNHWRDIANSDCILSIGANPAENHPASFGHMTDAMERGAKLISVDPRFTRTSARAHVYAPIRSGTDVAFIGGIIKWVLDDMWKQITGAGGNKYTYNLDYVSGYTNALYKIVSGFRSPGDAGQDGLFSGYTGDANETDNSKRNYGTASWAYDDADSDDKPDEAADLQTAAGSGNPRSVFEILRTHFVRYDMATVCKITGTPEETFEKVCEIFAATGQKGKAGTIMYAMGTTQHTNGTQMIRSYVILQLLLANIGVSGGGINALRGESNVQGSTDMCLLAHILPGYLKAPLRTNRTLGLDTSRAGGIIYDQDETDAAFTALSAADQAEAKNSYLWKWTPINNASRGSANWWQYTPKYMVSLLKAFYGESATGANDFGYDWLPKAANWADHYHIALFESMYAGDIKGLMCWGQNPAVSGPNAEMERKALEKLDWLVCVDLWETETSVFWKRPGTEPSDIDTEVFLLPAAASYEKEGSVTNSGRWMQWRYKALDPPGEAKNDLWIINRIMKRVKELYADEGGKLPEAIAAVDWNYGDDPDPKVVAREVNGYTVATGKLVSSFGGLKFDGSTSSGNWLYCNSYVEEDSLDIFEKAHIDQMFGGPDYVGNRATRRWPVDVGNGGYSAADGYREVGLDSYWSWCWPVNRRVIYNRASVDMDGVPWDSEHPVIEWNGSSWVGDVPDGGWKPINEAVKASETPIYPFIMLSEGVARIFAPGLADGPLPEHYEPWESPVSNLMSGQQSDPAFRLWNTVGVDDKGTANDYPIVCTTYRLVEQWQAGQMSRNLPWLVEMQPEVFVEMSRELAAEKGINNGDKVAVTSARGRVEAVAMVTRRFRPFTINGNTVHQVGIPWHWGYNGLSTGDSANVLTPHVGDANTMIPEYKAFLCNVERV